MELKSDEELANTRRKLQKLQSLYEVDAAENGDDDELREMEMESLARLIGQLKEEIAQYQAHQPAR